MTTQEISLFLKGIKEGDKLSITVMAPQIGNKLFPNEGVVASIHKDSETEEIIMIDFQEGISSLYLVKKADSQDRVWRLGGFPVESIQLIS